MDVGTQLSDARRQRGIGLRQIADATKLPMTTLDRIERNEFARLPGGLFTRAYLRAFASQVGLNPEAIVNDYLAQCTWEATKEIPFARQPAVEDASHPGRLLIIEIIAIALALGLFGRFRDVAQSRRAVAPLTVFEDQPSSLPPGSPGTSAPAPKGPRGHDLQVDIQPDGPCWVSATADGRVLFRRLLQNGDHAIATARNDLILRVGDPDTLSYWVNGARGRQLGEPGVPVTVQITHDNYETFVSVYASSRAG